MNIYDENYVLFYCIIVLFFYSFLYYQIVIYRSCTKLQKNERYVKLYACIICILIFIVTNVVLYDEKYVLQIYIYLTRNLLYTMLTCIKLHTEQMLFHVDIKMEPFRCEDDDSFLQDIICQSGEDAEYDDSQYLNDTGEGNADQ